MYVYVLTINLFSLRSPTFLTRSFDIQNLFLSPSLSYYYSYWISSTAPSFICSGLVGPMFSRWMTLGPPGEVWLPVTIGAQQKEDAYQGRSAKSR